MSFYRCTICGELFKTKKEANAHKCVPQIQDIIQRATIKFRQPRKLGERKSRTVREIAGAVELAWHRGYRAGFGAAKQEIQKVIKG